MILKNNERKKSYSVSDIELEILKTPLYELESDKLSRLLSAWYKRSNDSLKDQRTIWDYSYLAYKGIITNAELHRNRKKSAGAFGIYVNVPRTFAIIQGVRRNFQIEKLGLKLINGGDTNTNIEDFAKQQKINNLLNYDLRRSKSFKEIKDAGFNKLLFGNGFLHSFLLDRKGEFGDIAGKPDKKEGRVKATKKKVNRYYGMVSRSISPYKIFPDPDADTLDVNDHNKQMAKFVCIRKLRHINDFKRAWRGIVPEEVLDKVEAGGDDMADYEAIKKVTDTFFQKDSVRYPGTNQDYLSETGVKANYKNDPNYLEERLWLGEDFYILQAGKGLQFCLISPNVNPRNRINLTKLDNVSLPDEFWSLGEPYIIRYQQVEENRVHNAVLDSVHFAMAGMLGINTAMLEDPEDTEIYPQKVFKIKAAPGVKVDDVIQQFSTTGNNSATGMKFAQEIKEIGQQASAITDFVTGSSKSIADTATETDRLSSASDLAVMDKIKEIASEAMVNVGKINLDMYPVAYGGEKIEMVDNDGKLVFVGKSRDDISEEELTEIFQKFEDTEIIFPEEIEVDSPDFKIVGDVSLDKTGRINQWSAAIDYAAKINEQAYETGDPRRLDIIQMGLQSLTNFDVIDDPNVFLMEGQQTKMDEMAANAQMNQQQQNPGGRPKEARTSQIPNKQNELRSKKQPNYKGKNKSENKK